MKQLSWGLLLLLSACQQAAVIPEQPAVLSESSTAVRLEIQHAIQQAIGGDLVTLADNVFLLESEVWLERTVLRDERGLPLDGRTTAAANLFQLKLKQGQCYLWHRKSNQYIALTQAHCVAEQQRYPDTTPVGVQP